MPVETPRAGSHLGFGYALREARRAEWRRRTRWTRLRVWAVCKLWRMMPGQVRAWAFLNDPYPPRFGDLESGA